MIFKKIKYIFISCLIVFLVFSSFCFALSDDIYVWSNNTTTSVPPSNEESNIASQNER